ncbi:MAG: hypothetical protein HUJ95_04415 [Bacteroidales bacterium]|nr:hypothetical protein [Bacteroidales bacterium]
MKRFILIIAFLALIGCNNVGKTCPKPVEDFITNLYNNYVFNYGELDSIACNFSPTVLDSLRAAYDKEYCDGSPAYAVWLFRTDQNGSDNESIDEIKVVGKDLYKVCLTDGSTPCTCLMQIVMKDENPVLIGFKTEYENRVIDFMRK